MSAQTSIGANDGRIQTAVTLAETGPFTIDYPFFSLDDNVITITSAAGTITTYTRGVDYTIAATANDDGIYPSGTVTWLGAGIPVAGTLTRYRVTSLTRASQLPLTGYLDRTSVNADLNKQIMALQDQLRIGYGTIRFPEEDGNAAADKILPPESQAPNTALLFDASGNPYYGTLTASTGVSAFMATVLDDTTAAAALATLGAIGSTIVDAAGDLIVGTAADAVARLPKGTALHVLRVNAGATALEWAAAPNTTGPTYQYLTSGTAATYTTPAGVKWIRVRMVGGGGGAGGVGTGTGPTGATGGTTTFNTTTAIGGTGGSGGTGTPGGSSPGGGVGGTGGTGTAMRACGNGGIAGAVVSATNHAAGAGGGSAFFGGGAPGIVSGTTGGSAATNTGGGGSGANATGTAVPANGGGGGESAEFIIISPAATYTYTIGAGGAGGIGTGGGAATGGAGGSGYIVVEEHYNF